jgi:hypothetical protein
MSTPSEYADKAEVMLSIVGDPQTREEHFLAAQTLAIVGLVRLMSGEPLTASGYETCDYAMRIGHYQGDRTGFIEALRYVDACYPGWDDRANPKKIQAIRALREGTKLGLKEAKDVIEFLLTKEKFW